MKKLLKEYFKLSLQEAAVSASQAKSGGLALSFVKDGDETTAILYNPKNILNFVENLEISDENEAAEQIENTIEQNIIGMIRFAKAAAGECYGAFEIMRSAAEKGYGPLLYQIAMAVSPTKTIVPDRGSVSQSASGIWNKYFQRGDVKKLELDDESNPKTPETDDDCKVYNDPKQKFLDFAYKGQGETGYSSLVDGHEEFLTDLSFTLESKGLDPENFVNKAFKDAASKFFTTKVS